MGVLTGSHRNAFSLSFQINQSNTYEHHLFVMCKESVHFYFLCFDLAFVSSGVRYLTTWTWLMTLKSA